MIDQFLPRVVIVLGPSGAGKSAFCEHWCGLFPQYSNADDLAVISEYLRVERTVADARSPEALRATLSELAGQLNFIPDIVHLYLRELSEALPSPHYCRPLDRVTMKITSPVVWDDAVLRLARSLRPSRHYLVQLARGHDENYLTKFHVKPHEVYTRTLELFFNALDPSLGERLAIIHITAPYEARLNRNELRRTVTGHFVPEDVMREVFTHDIFSPEYLEKNHRDLRRAVTTISGRSIPTLTVNNDKDRAEDSLSIFLSEAAAEGMKFFVSAVADERPAEDRKGPPDPFDRAAYLAEISPLRTFLSLLSAAPPQKEKTSMVLVCHLLDSTASFIAGLARRYLIEEIYAIPYSINQRVAAELKTRYSLTIPETTATLERQLTDRCLDFLRRSTNRLLIQDVGGYALHLASSERIRGSNLLGVVEDTNQGHWRYGSSRSLQVPVLSIAQSRLKDLENTLIGHALVFSLENLLRAAFHQPLGGKQILLLGYGKIGRAAAAMLRGRAAAVSVFDPNPIARTQARIDGFKVGTKDELLPVVDLVLGVSGKRSLDRANMEILRDGAILASGSSKTVEFDIDGMRALQSSSKWLGEHVERITLRGGKSLFLLYGGQPINFIHGSSLGDILDLVFSSLLECGVLLEQGCFASGLHVIPSEVEEKIVNNWEALANGINIPLH